MNSFKPLLLPLLLTLALGACQKQDTAPAPAAEPAATPVVEAAPVVEVAPAPAVVDATPTSEPLGVPECDNYLTKYEACVATKVPAETRDALKQSLDATRGAWKQAIASGGKDALAAACTQMTEAAKTSMQAYGCTDF